MTIRYSCSCEAIAFVFASIIDYEVREPDLLWEPDSRETEARETDARAAEFLETEFLETF